MPQKIASGDPTPHTPLKGSLRHEAAKVLAWHVQTRPVVPPSLLRRCAGRSRPSLRCMMGLGAWAPANRATLAVSVQGWSVCPATRGLSDAARLLPFSVRLRVLGVRQTLSDCGGHSGIMEWGLSYRRRGRWRQSSDSLEAGQGSVTEVVCRNWLTPAERLLRTHGSRSPTMLGCYRGLRITSRATRGV